MWWTGSAVGFDLESDSADPTDARIITSATVQINPLIETAAMEIMVKPERPIAAEATAIHGISTERAEAEGMERDAAMWTIIEQLQAAGPECPVVGHNVSYDLTVLDREMRRTDVGHLSTDEAGMVVIVTDGITAASFPVIDTYVLDKAVDRYRSGKRQLSFAATFYGVPMAEGAAHGATADVFAALRIAYKIAQRSAAANSNSTVDRDMVISLYRDRRKPHEMLASLARIGALDLLSLHAAQRRWAVEQAEGLRDYFIKKGDAESARSVDGRWPIRPLAAIEDVDTTII
jgi:DNA polymerase-3 subunit epsilon